jgi:hypothetical protein
VINYSWEKKTSYACIKARKRLRRYNCYKPSTKFSSCQKYAFLMKAKVFVFFIVFDDGDDIP